MADKSPNSTEVANLLANMLIRIVALEPLMKAAPFNVSAAQIEKARSKVSNEIGWPPQRPFDSYQQTVDLLNAFLGK
jgi:hypothetical protein